MGKLCLHKGGCACINYNNMKPRRKTVGKFQLEYKKKSYLNLLSDIIQRFQLKTSKQLI